MKTQNQKYTNPLKVITGKDTRWSYCNVWEAKAINGGTPKFSVSLLIPKSDTVTVKKIKDAIEAAYREGEAKLKGNGKTVPPLESIKAPLRDGDLDRPDDPAYENSYFIRIDSTSLDFLGQRHHRLIRRMMQGIDNWQGQFAFSHISTSRFANFVRIKIVKDIVTNLENHT